MVHLLFVVFNADDSFVLAHDDYCASSYVSQFWVRFGSILGPFWVHFGSISGEFRGFPGIFLGHFRGYEDFPIPLHGKSSGVDNSQMGSTLNRKSNNLVLLFQRNLIQIKDEPFLTLG